MKMLFTGLAGLLVGAVITMAVVWTTAPGMMMLEDESRYGFEESLSEFRTAAEKAGWKIPVVHDLQATMAKFGKDVRRVQVFELCHPDHAYEILSRDDERIVSSMMPCRVAFYEKSDGKTYVSRMNTGLMGKMMSGVIPTVMADATRDSEAILNSVLPVSPSN